MLVLFIHLFYLFPCGYLYHLLFVVIRNKHIALPLIPMSLCLLYRYKEGMLKARHRGDEETEQVVQSVAEGMLTITDTRGQDAVEDWEVDELLEWTNGLNFDQYVDWKCVFLYSMQIILHQPSVSRHPGN